MAKVDIGWFGHYSDKTSDKIWGWAEIEGTPYIFWARRLARIQFKHSDFNEVNRVARQKAKKGYREITDETVIDGIYPDFMTIVQRQLFNAKMRGRVLNEGD